MTSNLKSRYTLVRVAETNAQVSDFAPYVPSINNDGLVAFQAALRRGGSGVFTGDGAVLTAVTDAANGPFHQVCSHPDLNLSAALCFYATLKSGDNGVFVIQEGEVRRLAGSFGPLGPTMNEAGSVAFRATGSSGVASVMVWHAGRATVVAEAGAVYQAFHGLPVMHRGASVLFRADLRAGGQGIYVGDGERVVTIVESGAEFRGLGHFPMINDAGTVAFCATLQAGGSGVYLASDGRIETFVDSSAGFESFRGVLINNSGPVAFFATPTGDSLGVFTGPDPVEDCLLAVGSSLYDSTIAEFALNPVSVNDTGQIAIRVRLADQRQYILRADPNAHGAAAIP